MPTPRKRFGQHFLCDKGVIQEIVKVLNPQKEEHLIEIGPGQGALTVPVLKRTKLLEAIELDRDLIPILEKRCQAHGALVIYAADALTFDFARLVKAGKKLRIFGNLPYNISTPFIFHLLKYASSISDMLLMLQKEVAERITAQAGSAHYGRLSVMVQYHCQVEFIFNVPAKAFFPLPQVQSSLIRLVPYVSLPYTAHDYALFELIVRTAFNMRRKTLRNSLKEIVSDAVWEAIEVHSDRRPEELRVQDFIEIAKGAGSGMPY